PAGVRQIVVPLREEQAKRDSPIIGAVILEYSQIHELLFGAVRERLVLIGASGVICVLLSIMFGLRIARQIAGRIENLRAGVGIVAAGDYETRVSVISADELGALGTAFNDMAQALKASRDELEERVAVRTRELSQANNQLRAEVEQRAQAEAKMAHLAQF